MKWNRTAPLPPIRGVLLDMDGLLIDSEHIAQQCCIQAGYDLGYPIDQTLARRFLGVTHDGCVQILQDAFPGIDAESLFPRLFVWIPGRSLAGPSGAGSFLCVPGWKKKPGQRGHVRPSNR